MDPITSSASIAPSAPEPRREYAARQAARQTEVARLDQQDRWIANSRLLVVVAGVLLYWLLPGRTLSLAVAAGAALLFLGLIIVHDRVLGARRRMARAAAWYTAGLARIDGTWAGGAGGGDTGERFADAAHPYAQDLDLFGKGSLFELLCTARTAAGSQTLASWLLAPAPPEEARARQEAVRELRGRLDHREALALLAEDVSAAVEPGPLVTWSARPSELPSPLVRLLIFMLGLATLAALVAWAVSDVGALPFFVLVVVVLLVQRRFQDSVRRITGPVDRRSDELAVLARILFRLEQDDFASGRLRELQAALGGSGASTSTNSAERTSASVAIAALGRRVHALDTGRNQLLAPLAFLTLWTPQLAWAIEAWRQRHGAAVARWLAAVGEYEALDALAAYAYEHPDDVFPEIAEAGTSFDGEGLTHPLLQAGVRNDVHLGNGTPRVLVVSGSNMSGKSTLLRTVGINAVLALAGAPVRAHRLRLSCLALGATLRIQDSLLQGSSRFYAEITRLRQLVALAEGPHPLLFLLDEILHGTNSHDRRIGAEAVIRGLIGRGALGLVTTHDLALAAVVPALGGEAANVHFEDHLENGRLCFDYKMREGVVTKSNALELMRAVGLEV
jgi:Flp pilus assembly protein TadB